MEAISFIGTRGGVGTTTTAAAFALKLATTPDARVLFVDATETGDGAAVFGLGSRPDYDEIAAAAPDLDLLAITRGGVIEAVHNAGQRDYTAVVVDGGSLPAPAPNTVNADRFYLVADGAYTGLRRAIGSDLTHCAGIVMIEHPGRAIGAREVADVLHGLPIATRIPARDAIARAVDAGVLAHRLPDVLGRAVGYLTAVSVA